MVFPWMSMQVQCLMAMASLLLEKGREKLLEFGALPHSRWARHPHALMHQDQNGKGLDVRNLALVDYPPLVLPELFRLVPLGLWLLPGGDFAGWLALQMKDRGAVWELVLLHLLVKP